MAATGKHWLGVRTEGDMGRVLVGHEGVDTWRSLGGWLAGWNSIYLLQSIAFILAHFSYFLLFPELILNYMIGLAY